MAPICNQILVPHNQLVCIVIVEVSSNNYEGFTLRIEYSRIHQYSRISTEWEENKIP
jgi:hypothetical protein